MSGAATLVQSDGEESVGTAEHELPMVTHEERSGKPAWIPGDVVEHEEESESILPLFEGRYGYDAEEEDEEPEYSAGPVRRMAVYTAPSINVGASPSTVVPPVSNPADQQQQ